MVVSLREGVGSRVNFMFFLLGGLLLAPSLISDWDGDIVGYWIR